MSTAARTILSAALQVAATIVASALVCFAFLAGRLGFGEAREVVAAVMRYDPAEEGAKQRDGKTPSAEGEAAKPGGGRLALQRLAASAPDAEDVRGDE